MNLQKFFEIQEPYYALIKAEDEETAINVYTDVVADFDEGVNPYFKARSDSMDEECYCSRCHRRLKSERLIKAGLGPTCRVKRAEEEFLKNQMTIFDLLGGETDDKS